MKGNNYRSDKIVRISLPIVQTSNINASTFGKYYFSDNPIINSGIIIGMQAHLSDLTATPDNDISLGAAKSLNSKPLGNVGIGFARASTLTLMDKEKREILSNFPITSLWNTPTTGNKKNKIVPFFLKADLSKSYVSFIGIIPPFLPYIPVINISFYLK